MPLSQPVTPGAVDWTGENPGILLKDPNGGFAAMALFFRVAWSPAGQGHVLLLYGAPQETSPHSDSPNILVSDNQDLADYLVDNFIGKLAAFRDAPAFEHLQKLGATDVQCHGDPMGDRYSETIACDGYQIELVWEELEAPRALELNPEQVGTGEHTMFTVLVPAQQAKILVNGNALSGQLGTRVQAGFETTTAFLYFSETWIIPPAD